MIAPDAGLEFTYGRLKEDSIRLGKHLMKRGLRKGDKISFLLSNGYQTTRIFLGAMYGGWLFSAVNLQAQPSQLEYVADHSDTKLIFFTEDQQGRVEEAVGKVKRPIETIPIDNDSEHRAELLF